MNSTQFGGFLVFLDQHEIPWTLREEWEDDETEDARDDIQEKK